jgi:hypothetical protein
MTPPRIPNGSTYVISLAQSDISYRKFFDYSPSKPVRSEKFAGSKIVNSLERIIHMSMTDKELERARARFWSKVIIQRGDGCWLWDGQSDYDKGYGRFSLDNKKNRKMSAHRASWVLNRGSIPSGLLVCHTCDNPPCVRPDHLFLGTALDNTRDMMRKGRSGYQRYPERYNTPLLRQIRREIFGRLTDEQVMEIRTSLASYSELARRFGLADVSIRNIRRGRRYAHLPPARRNPVLKRGVKLGMIQRVYASKDCASRRSPKRKHPATCACKC